MITLTNRSRRPQTIVLAGDSFRWYTDDNGRRIADSLTIFPGKTSPPLHDDAATLPQVKACLRSGKMKLSRIAAVRKAKAKPKAKSKAKAKF